MPELKKHLFAILLLGVSFNGWTATIPNPDPAELGPDINQSGLFNHTGAALSIEILDQLEIFTGGTIGFEFGFYYGGSDPFQQSQRHIIFGAEDNNALLTTPQLATVDFVNGVVVDLDALLAVDLMNVEQSTFTPDPLGASAIGFFLNIPVIGPLFGIPVPIFTQALLNPGGEDLAAEFPSLTIPQGFLIAFAVPDGIGTVPDGTILSYHAVGPLSPVPLPGALGLWLLGIGGLALFRRRLAKMAV